MYMLRPDALRGARTKLWHEHLTVQASLPVRCLATSRPDNVLTLYACTVTETVPS